MIQTVNLKVIKPELVEVCLLDVVSDLELLIVCRYCVSCKGDTSFSTGTHSREYGEWPSTKQFHELFVLSLSVSQNHFLFLFFLFSRIKF